MSRMTHAWILTPFLGLAVGASAATLVWTGGGADDNFSTAENWNPQQAPATGDTLTFAGETRTTPYNDLDPELYTFANLRFENDNSSGKTAAFTLTGNKLKVSSSIKAAKATSGSLVETFDLPVEFTGGATIGGTEGSVSNHGFTFKKALSGPSSLTLSNTSQYGSTIRFEGDVTGFSKYYRPNGDGHIYFLGNNNAFTGDGGIDFGQGKIHIVDASNLGGMTRVKTGQGGYGTAGVLYVAATNDVTLTTKMGVTGPSQTDNGLTIENSTAGTTLTIAGDVVEIGTKNNQGTRLVVQGPGNGVFTGSFLKDRMAFYKGGTGTWTFSDEMPSCALTGLVTVAAGKLVVDTTVPTYRMTVAKNTTLAGSGTVGTASSRIEFASGSVYEIGTAGDAAQALTIPGAVVLNGGVTINLTGGLVLAKGSRTTLLTFGSKSGAGSFAVGTGFPEGTVFTLGETVLYADVPSDTLTWSGAQSSAWNTTDANWDGGAVFTEGKSVLFPDLADDAKRTISIPSAVRPFGATVNAAAERPYVFAGAGGLDGASQLVFAGAATNVWEAPLKDVAQVNVDAGGLVLRGPTTGCGLHVAENASLQLEGALTDGSLEVNLGGSVTQGVASVIGGAAQLVLKTATADLCGTNTFTGGVIVGENLIQSAANPVSKLNVRAPKALGDGGPVTVNYNSVLAILADVAETNRTLNIWGHNSNTRVSITGARTFDWAGDVYVYEYPNNEMFTDSGAGTFKFGKPDGSSVFRMVNDRYITFVADAVHMRAAFQSGSYLGFRSTLYLYNTNNYWLSFNIDVGTGVMMATNALYRSAGVKLLQQWNNVEYSATLDLNGFDQTITRIDSDYNPKVRNWGTIRSAKPAVLTIASTVSTSFNDTNTFYVTGQVTLRKAGSSTWTLGCQNTSEGDLVVDGGELRLAAAASAPTGRDSTLRVTEGAALGLAEGVDAEISYAETRDADGKTHLVRAGLYGGPDCAVAGARKVAWLAGAGTLRVLRDTCGTTLILR